MTLTTRVSIPDFSCYLIQDILINYPGSKKKIRLAKSLDSNPTIAPASHEQLATTDVHCRVRHVCHGRKTSGLNIRFDVPSACGMILCDWETQRTRHTKAWSVSSGCAHHHEVSGLSAVLNASYRTEAPGAGTMLRYR